MQILSAVWGALAAIGMFIGFIPCLGSLNWLNIPFALAGLVVSIIALSQAKPGQKAMPVIGVVLCGIAVLLGFFRLLLGGGIL